MHTLAKGNNTFVRGNPHFMLRVMQLLENPALVHVFALL